MALIWPEILPTTSNFVADESSMDRKEESWVIERAAKWPGEGKESD